jgi:hypothetical protein
VRTFAEAASRTLKDGGPAGPGGRRWARSGSGPRAPTRS